MVDRFRAAIVRLVELTGWRDENWCQYAKAWSDGSLQSGALVDYFTGKPATARDWLLHSFVASVGAACSRDESKYALARLREHVAYAAVFIAEGTAARAMKLLVLVEDGLVRVSGGTVHG